MSFLNEGVTGDRHLPLSLPSNRLRQQHIQHRTVEDQFFDWLGANRCTDNDTDFTIAFQNVHGLCSRQQSLESKLSELIDNMTSLHLSALCISEHHISLSDAPFLRIEDYLLFPLSPSYEC
jgi:hypothetical protein